MQYIMAFDQGTTSSRCILFNHKGKICGMAQKNIRQSYPKAGWVEHNPMEILSSQLEVAKTVLHETGITAQQISAIGITNQRETTIVSGQKHRRACLSCDCMAMQKNCGTSETA